MSCFACCKAPEQPAIDERERLRRGLVRPTSLPATFISTKRVAFHSLLQKFR